MKDMVQIRRSNRQEYKGPDAKIGRSQFNRSCGLKTSFNAGRLYPIFLDEVLPGDTMTMSLDGFARIFSPLLSPVMDNITLETFFFYCPTRLLWNKWVDFQGEHDDAGMQDTVYTIPVIGTGMVVDHDNVVTYHGLGAHLGLPDGMTTAGTPNISALPFRMYSRVYNEWFRDQNLIAPIYSPVDNGPDTASQYAIMETAKKHDYFTSSLPYLQKGTATGFDATVVGLATGHGNLGSPEFVAADGSPAAGAGFLFAADTSTGPIVEVGGPWTGVERLHWAATELVAQIDINTLRQSVAIQRLLERDARGGTRYTEIIKAHFGVTSPDFRLQRPEYLGGGKSFINISPVANTREILAADAIGSANVFQGSLAGIGTGVIQGHGWAKSFTEHGYIMGLVRARGDITYFQGIDKLFTRAVRYDFYMPALAMLGEQSVLNYEIFSSNSAGTDKSVFGYQERWAEYRMKKSQVAGNFNPDVSGSLAHWHLAEDFSSLPSLNQAFVQDSTPMDRVIAVTTEPDFLLDIWFNYKCARPLPVYSVPSLVGRF